VVLAIPPVQNRLVLVLRYSDDSSIVLDVQSVELPLLLKGALAAAAAAAAAAAPAPRRFIYFCRWKVGELCLISLV
jgi:hypothetical protein